MKQQNLFTYPQVKGFCHKNYPLFVTKKGVVVRKNRVVFITRLVTEVVT